jgi:hypothetical protein
MVEIDATMVTPEMINMVLDIVNRWSVSEKRWGRDHHDHAMQIASVRIPIFNLPPQRMLPARIAAHYRDPEAVEAVDMNVRRLLQQHAGIFEMLYAIEEQMDYGMMDTTQLVEDGKTVIANDEAIGVLQWTVN